MVKRSPHIWVNNLNKDSIRKINVIKLTYNQIKWNNLSKRLIKLYTSIWKI